MWKVNAVAFYWISTALQRMHAVTRMSVDKLNYSKDTILSEKTSGDLKKNLQLLGEELDIIGARMSAASVRRLDGALASGKGTFGQVIELSADIDRRLRDELELVNLYVLDEDRIKYFAPANVLLGQDVVDKFPLAVTDIEDAGKGLSFGLGTSSVFHSMRVMESGLKALARLLEIPYAPSWESYLKQINDKITEKHKDKTPEWKTDEPLFRDLSGDLQAVKIAWRNPTMHVVRSYSIEEAEGIFRAVKTFMQRLAPKIPMLS
ncbi:MAG: hypothetical protein WBD53_10495 [Xanthobacteraceae bacterium]